MAQAAWIAGYNHPQLTTRHAPPTVTNNTGGNTTRRTQPDTPRNDRPSLAQLTLCAARAPHRRPASPLFGLGYDFVPI